jgi:glyoxylase-like metal-dependent hydrolase (beta-lactamase superfamily II)
MSLATTLEFPHATPPDNGHFCEVAPGILWLRLALPFALNHVNLYLIEDDDGWALLDTGIADARTRLAWKGLLSGGLGGRRITRLIVTHYHPDHAGLAGWIAERCNVELSMSQADWLTSQFMRHNPTAIDAPERHEFYRRHGLDAEAAAAVASRGHGYLHMTTDLPVHYHRLIAGETLTIGGRVFEILTGGGHAPEQVMLFCREAGVFLAADQVLARISPNISVMGHQPEANPLGLYLQSLAGLRAAIPDNVLVLPMHNLPFFGLHQRTGELRQHHEARCDEVLEACATVPRSTAEVLPFLFPRALDLHQKGFAFGEALAHINLLVRGGDLRGVMGADGVLRFARV